MEGSYLLALLKTLRPEERAAFERFASAHLSSEKHRQSQTIALLKLLLAALPGRMPSKTQVLHQLFPGSPPGKLEKTMVDAVKVLRRFLLSARYFDSESGLRHQIEWTALLKERGLDLWQQQSLAKLSRQQRDKTSGKPEDCRDRFETEYAVFQHEADHNHLRGDLNVPQTLDALEIYYHVTRLSLLNQYLLQQKVAKLEVPVSMGGLPAHIPIAEHYLEASPLLLISYKINQLLSKEPPSVDDFQALAGLLRAHEASLDPVVVKDFYTYLRSSCALLINAGAEDLLGLYHQLQVDSLSRGYLYYEGNRIPPSAYLAVTTGALRCGNFDWARDFIEAHKGRVLGDNATSDLYRLNRAHYCFAVGEYQEALDLLVPTYEYLDYTLPGKRLELKILYETGSDLLPYKAGAFKIFVSRASRKFMSAALRKANAEFVNLLLQIIRSRPRDPDRGARLSRRIQARPQAAERDWLLEKAARLR